MATKEEKKVTNEKPVSLHPLEFRRVLDGLLKTAPAKDKESGEKKQKKSDQE